jgi:Haem-binding uptake, Tiki superfamily, ChaN
MATTTSLRSRRSAAQLHALARVEREIRAQDRNGRRKYLRDYTQAYRSYESVLDRQQLNSLVYSSDILLVGDYHALPASQRFAAALLEARAQPGDRPVVLGVETIFSRDQHVLDEWWRREIDETELRQRIRFDLDWGYDWQPFYELLLTAREHAEGVYGLDCMPREDLRKIGARDRHAVHKIAELRQRHPSAVILALFGESHLAPAHLPRRLRAQLPGERPLTILQNVDALYWRAAGEPQEHVEAVRVGQDVVCVFNSTPLEKYENYRLCLARWNREEDEAPDAGPTIYNLIDGLLRFLDINRYSSHNGTQPKFLVDLLPEIYCGTSEAHLRRLLSRTGTDAEAVLHKVEERGSVYLPQVNAFYVREFQMMYVAEEVARFLHHACRGLLSRGNILSDKNDNSDRLYCLTVEYALGYFGSRVLYPARSPKDESAPATLDLNQEALGSDGVKSEATAQQVGYGLGNNLYDAYLEGRVTRCAVRRLFLAQLEKPGTAREICLLLANGFRPQKKKARAAAG